MRILRLIILLSTLSTILSYGVKSFLIFDDLDTSCVCVKNQEGLMDTWQVQCSDKQTKKVIPCSYSYGNICKSVMNTSQCDSALAGNVAGYFVAEPVPKISLLFFGFLNLLSFSICVISILIYLASKLKMLVEPKKSYRNHI